MLQVYALINTLSLGLFVAADRSSMLLGGRCTSIPVYPVIDQNRILSLAESPTLIMGSLVASVVADILLEFLL